MVVYFKLGAEMSKFCVIVYLVNNPSDFDTWPRIRPQCPTVQDQRSKFYRFSSFLIKAYLTCRIE